MSDNPALGLILRGGRSYALIHRFNGAALTPSDLGPDLTGAGLVVSNGVLTKTDGTQRVVGITGGLPSDVTVQLKVNFGNSPSADRRVQFRIRQNGTDRIQCLLQRNTSSLQISRIDAGSATVIASAGSLEIADSMDFWLRFVAKGPRLEAFTSTDGVTFIRRAVAAEGTYASNTGADFVLTDTDTGSTIAIDDLLAWRGL